MCDYSRKRGIVLNYNENN